MSVQPNPDIEASLGEDEIASYLAAHPDFFERHLDVLESLRIPHPVRGGVISLIERQVIHLRQHNERLQRKLQMLMHNAFENEGLMRRMHQLALALVHAHDLNEVLESTREQLCHGFKTDFVELRLFKPMREEVVAAPLDYARVQALMPRLVETRRPQCGPLAVEPAQLLFGELAGEVASAAVVLLTSAEPIGVLALGSREQARFVPSAGTLFLGYLGEMIATAIAVHLDPSHG